MPGLTLLEVVVSAAILSLLSLTILSASDLFRRPTTFASLPSAAW